MQAAIFTGPNHIRVSSVAKPTGEIRLKVKACGVCGYDVRVFRNGHKKVSPPVILGHEICGELLDTVSNEKGEIRAGTRVSVYPQVPCVGCHYCLNGDYNLCVNLQELGSTVDGGFAEYVRIPKQIARIGGLVPVPENLGDEEGALLEPLACCVNSVSRIQAIAAKKDRSGKCPIVIIGDGPIGLMHLLHFKNMMPTSPIAIVGRINSRMDKARSFGADLVIEYRDIETTIKRLMDFSSGVGASIVVVATSNSAAVELAKQAAGKGSLINLFAGMPENHQLSLESSWLHYNEVTVTGTFGSTPENLMRAAELASTGKVDLSGLVTKRYALSEIERALVDTEKYTALRSVVNRF